jgi:hypothetical protein
MRLSSFALLIALAPATPAAAQSCNIIGSAIICNGFSASAMQPSPFSLPRVPDLVGTNAFRASQEAAQRSVEAARATAAYNALYRYCGALAYYGPRCLSMVRTFRQH